MTDLTTILESGEQPDRTVLAGFLRTCPAEATRRAYAHDLGIPPAWIPERTPPGEDGARRGARPGEPTGLEWLIWCARHGLAASTVHEQDINRWLDELTEHGFARATIARMLSAVTALYRHLINEGLATANPATLVDRGPYRRENRRRPRPADRWTLRQCRALLEAAWLLAEHTRNGLRDRAMTEVLVGTGVSAAELVGLDVGDYDRQPGQPGRVRIHRRAGSADRVRQLTLATPVADAVENYLAVRRIPAAADPAAATEAMGKVRYPLFVSANGIRLHDSHVTVMLRQLCRAFVPATAPRARWHRDLLATEQAAAIGTQLAPLATSIHPHSAGLAYALRAAKRGDSRRQVQLDLGQHRETTANYLASVRGDLDDVEHRADERGLELHSGWLPPSA
jgi:site-specific recombinase XerD